jgi:hypothetical protein
LKGGFQEPVIEDEKMNGFDLIIKPDKDDEEDAEILVEVMLGERPYQFLLDTGAKMTSVRADDFTGLLAGQGTHESAGVIGREQNDLITLPHLKLGPIERTDLPVARISQENVHARNLLGMDVLKDWCCTFLFDQNWVSLEPAQTAGLLDLFLDDVYHPYVPVECQGSPAPAVWDTGASLTCVDIGFILAHPAAFTEAGRSAGSDASGSTLETPLYVMSNFSCAGHPFPPHKVVGIDLSPVNARIENPMTMILGHSTLSKANWLFDFPGRKWGIVRMLAKE